MVGPFGEVLVMDWGLAKLLDGRSGAEPPVASSEHRPSRRVEAYPEGLLRKAARLYTRHRVAFWLIVAYLVVRGSVLFFTRR